MILSGKRIIEEQGKGLTITPFVLDRVNPNSYNLRLHNKLLVYENATTGLDMKNPNPYREVIIPEYGLWLKPNTLYLGRTVEHTKTDKFVPMLEGRSSIGRLGICIHVTAGFGDVGFNGFWTLELFCIHPVIIYPNIEICQIYYHTIDGDFEPYSSGKYNNNTEVQPSLIYKDFEKGKKR